MVSDPPFTNLIQGSDHNKHNAFEGHGKGMSPVKSQIVPSPILFMEATTTSMMHLKVTRKGMSPVRSRILLSPVLFKRVTTTKSLCSLDDFLVEKSFSKRRIIALWGRRHFRPDCILISRNTNVLKRRGNGSTVLHVEQSSHETNFYWRSFRQNKSCRSKF